jgi:transcriptional regulator with XRE-family HTH domain
MPSEMRTRIAKAVARFRLERGWDQATLALRADLPLAELQGIESAEEACRIDTLTDLAQALGVPVERLVEPSDTPTQ